MRLAERGFGWKNALTVIALRDRILKNRSAKDDRLWHEARDVTARYAAQKPEHSLTRWPVENAFCYLKATVGHGGGLVCKLQRHIDLQTLEHSLSESFMTGEPTQSVPREVSRTESNRPNCSTSRMRLPGFAWYSDNDACFFFKLE